MLIDNIIKKYSGNGVKIAVIDNGYLNKSDNDNKLYRYKLVEDKFILTNSCEKRTEKSHGEICIEALRKSANDADVYSLDVRNDNNQITEKSIIKGILFSIELGVNIISISQGLKESSISLFSVINVAKQHGIIICAAKDKEYIMNFPCDIDGVIGIDVELDCIWDGIEYFNDIVMISTERLVNISNKKDNSFVSSSCATAYFSGICACYLEFNPLATMETIIDRVFDQITGEEAIFKQSSIVSNAFLLYDNANIRIDDYSELISPRYIGYYDSSTHQFQSLDKKNDKDIKALDIINANRIKRKNIVPHFISNTPDINFIGNFEYSIKRNLQFDTHKIRAIECPIIGVTSYGYDMEKSKIQLEINKQFNRDNISVANITYNPRGWIFDFCVLDYPNSITYPDYVYQINQMVQQESLGAEITFINIPGMINYGGNEYTLGELHNLFAIAVNFDIIILSVSDFVSIKDLLYRKKEIESHFGAKLIIYITNQSKGMNIDNYDGNDTSEETLQLIDKERVEEYREYIQQCIDVPVFVDIDLETGVIYKMIIEALTE